MDLAELERTERVIREQKGAVSFTRVRLAAVRNEEKGWLVRIRYYGETRIVSSSEEAQRYFDERRRML